MRIPPRRRPPLAGLLLAIALLGAGALAARAANSLPLANGDLSKGAGTSPDHWETQAWQEGSGFSTFKWNHPAGQPAELVVINQQPNDARWMQPMTLSAGWYYFSVTARAVNVGAGGAGAGISILEDGVGSAQLKGTTGWQRIGFYLKVGKHGADIELALRLGGFSSTNTGEAYFRDVRMERLTAPPAGAAAQFDLDQVRKQGASAPVGRPWTLVATYLFLALIACLGWWAYSDASKIAERTSQAIPATTRRPPRRSS